MTKLIIEYRLAVQTAAGWRQVYAKAIAEKLSEKRCKVLTVLSFDGEHIKPRMSRTGANRQQYSAGYFADNEVGKIKNISSLFKFEVGND